MKKNIWLYGAIALLMAVMPLGSEPHLIGKIRWVVGGAIGMSKMDWFDLFIHGGPLILYVIYLIYSLKKKKSSVEAEI